MAYGLISKLRNGKNAITFAELRDKAQKLQNELNTSDIDAVVLTYFDKALYEWSDYFTSVEVNGDYYVKCAPGVGLHNLEYRFIGYLPLKVFEVMIRIWLQNDGGNEHGHPQQADYIPDPYETASEKG